jgi:lipopolysaccharide export system protein LptA
MTKPVKLLVYRHKIQVVCVLCLFSLCLCTQTAYSKASFAFPKTKAAKANVARTTKQSAKQQNQPSGPQSSLQLFQQKKRKDLPPKKLIFLEHADALHYDAMINPDYQILSGNVRFRHENAYLYCDSAHFFSKTNSLYAFGNVHMEQGDTLFLYGAWLFYDGNTRLAMVREKVRLENRKVTLFTDSLNYDRISNIAYFFDGGLLVDETNKLSSEYGQYSPETKIADFQHNVKLVHPKFVMTNQELKYNTESGIASIMCPTNIVADSGFIYSDNGWYNTRDDKSRLFHRSYIINNHRHLIADTLHYDKKNGIGEAFGNVILTDTVQHITLTGNHGYSNEKTNYALLTQHALMIEHSSKDTLYLHADTLISNRDSIYNAVTAFHGVRFYRTDFQGVCDSLYYSTKDSVLSFYDRPVLWSDQQQLTGEIMNLYTKNKKPDILHIQKAAMVISQEVDSLDQDIYYDQSSGKDLKAYFDSGQVVRVDIKGNAETVYLPRGDYHAIIGLNRLESSSLTLFMENKKMKKIIFLNKPKGKFYPLPKLDPEARYLKNFSWQDKIRPTGPLDVFREISKTDSTNLKSNVLKGREKHKSTDVLNDQKTTKVAKGTGSAKGEMKNNNSKDKKQKPK